MGAGLATAQSVLTSNGVTSSAGIWASRPSATARCIYIYILCYDVVMLNCVPRVREGSLDQSFSDDHTSRLTADESSVSPCKGNPRR